MIRKLIQMAFVGCIVIAAIVPAEAGIFDRIRNRNCGKKVGCCQPQTTCAPTPCATAPSCPCAREQSCLEHYNHNVKLCSKHFGNDPQKCAQCIKMAELAYCECQNQPKSSANAATAAKSATPPCMQPGVPTLESCMEFYEACTAREAAEETPGCATCYFKCLELIESVSPPKPMR